MNPLGDLIAAQQPSITDMSIRADQVSIIAVGLPAFVVAVEKVAQDPSVGISSTSGASLVTDANGPLWLVTSIDSALATTRLWQMLQDPKTYGQ